MKSNSFWLVLSSFAYDWLAYELSKYISHTQMNSSPIKKLLEQKSVLCRLCNTVLTKALNLWFLFPLPLKSSWKSYQLTPFFVQKEELGKNIIIWVKNDDVITQIMMFSHIKVNSLRAREQETTLLKEKKGLSNYS